MNRTRGAQVSDFLPKDNMSRSLINDPVNLISINFLQEETVARRESQSRKLEVFR